MKILEPKVIRCINNTLLNAYHEDDFSNSIFTEGSLQELFINNLTIDSCIFKNINFNNITFENVDLIDLSDDKIKKIGN